MGAQVSISIKPTGERDRKGQPLYKLDFSVDGEAGEEFFCMLAEFLHEAPEWVQHMFELAVKYNIEHDPENCPFCRPQS